MTAASAPRLVLASGSPRRRDLLLQIGIIPDEIVSSDIDETAHENELPKALCTRLGLEKAKHIAPEYPKSYILAADTVVAVGRRLLPKPASKTEAKGFLELMSGRSHRVYTGVTLISPDSRVFSKTVETRIKMKRLTDSEIDSYIDSNEWQGKAGAYGIQGQAEAFIRYLAGSYSNVVGLPLYETRNMLFGAGYK